MKKGVDIYSSAGTFKALGISGHRIHPQTAMVDFAIGSFRILPFPVEHDANEPFGYLIESLLTKERLLFFTDTYYIKFNFKNINILMAEANYSLDIIKEKVEAEEISEAHKNRVIKSHMSLETLVNFIKASDTSQLKKIYLLHMSDGNSNEDEFKKKIQEITGVEVEVC